MFERLIRGSDFLFLLSVWYKKVWTVERFLEIPISEDKALWYLSGNVPKHTLAITQQQDRSLIIRTLIRTEFKFNNLNIVGIILTNPNNDGKGDKSKSQVYYVQKKNGNGKFQK